MLLVGVAVFWSGYALAYFGYESIRGPGVGLLDLVVPGRFKGHANPATKPGSDSADLPSLSPAGPLPGYSTPPLSPSGPLNGGNPLSPSGVA